AAALEICVSAKKKNLRARRRGALRATTPLTAPSKATALYSWRLNASIGDDAEAMIVVHRHVPDQVDLPGQVLAHRILAVLPAVARRQEDVVGRVDRADHSGFDWQARLDPGLGAAGQGQH